MAEIDRKELWKTDELRVVESVWDHVRHPAERETVVREPHVVLLCSGCYRRRMGRTEHVGDVNTMTYSRPGWELEMNHTSRSLVGTTSAFAQDHWVEQLGGMFGDGPTPFSAPMSRATHLQHRAMLAAISAGRDPVEVDEAIYLVVRSAREDGGRAIGGPIEVVRRDTRAANERRINGVKEYIGACFADPIRLADIASAVHCSPFHLSRLFSEGAGITIGRYLIQTRLRHAVDLLLEGDSVRLASYATGFSSSSHFCDMFRREYGQCTTALRDLPAMVRESRHIANAAK